MKFDEFLKLSEEEQRAVYVDPEQLEQVETERDSYKDENEQLKKSNAELKESERETKKLNMTLARQVNVKPKRSSEEVLHDMFK